MTHTDIQYIYMLPSTQCKIYMPPSAQCKTVHVVDLGASTSTTFAHARAMEAFVIDVGSLPVKHAMSHVPPLHIAGIRPGPTDDHDPVSVHLTIDGFPMSIQTLCDTAEWVGQAAQTHTDGDARALRVVCDASLQKQVHPHLLRHYLDRTTPTTTPPRERWQCVRRRLRLTRDECMRLPDSLIWVFLFQPLSTHERSSHRKWVLASLTQTPGVEHWRLRYRSPTEGTQRVLVYRPHMAGALLPPTVPMDDRYTHDWTDPLSAVWFPAVTPTTGWCLPPPSLHPVTHITDVMRKARSIRACTPPRLWHDLLAYHAISVHVTNPVGNSTVDMLDVFSEFDDISFPCTESDPTYGGIGSNFSIIERAMAFDHALRNDALPGSSNHDTMDCPCVTNSGPAGRPCSMSLPGFMPHVWSQVASDFPNFAHDSWVATDSSAWDSDPPPTGPAYWCPCGAGFDTLTRLRWHTNGVHPPGSQHSSSLGLLSRIGGSYVVYDPETRAVYLCGLARFPVSGGNKPSSTYAETCTIFLAMFHAKQVLHPRHTYSTLTDSLSSVYGWDKSALPTTARASLSDKFSPIWLAVRTIVGRGDGLNQPSTTTVDWQCTEHGRLWSDPLRWTPDVLLHRVVDTAANVATSSGRHMEGQFVSLFVIPPCPPPVVGRDGGVHAYRTGSSHSHGSRHS